MEWAPLGLVNDSSKKTHDPNLSSKDPPAAAEKKAANAEEISEESDDKDYATLFVKNLKFSSSEENLRDHLSRLGVLPVQSGGPVRAVSIVKKIKVIMYEYSVKYVCMILYVCMYVCLTMPRPSI